MATISAIATDNGFEEVYAKQIRALGQPGDILVVITTTGNSRSLIKAAEAALSRDMTIIVLGGGDGERSPVCWAPMTWRSAFLPLAVLVFWK